MVGAPVWWRSGLSQGSAYVFVRSGGVWSQQQKLLASDAAAGDQFGHSVAISGETVVVGAPLDDGAAGSIKARPMSLCAAVESGASSRTGGLGRGAGDQFGISVAISGETVVVGVRMVAQRASQGSAYVFVRSGGVWSQQQKLEASDAAALTVSATRWRSAERRSWSARRLMWHGHDKARPMSLSLTLTPRRRSRSKLQSRSGRPITNTRP